MCTMIVQRIEIAGSGKAGGTWFPLSHAVVAYDHPFHAPWEHALNIDFVDEAEGPAAHVSAELSPESARRLADTIISALDRGDAYQATRGASRATGTRAGT